MTDHAHDSGEILPGETYVVSFPIPGSGETSEYTVTRLDEHWAKVFQAMGTLRVRAGRNAPCPCGSGLKSKRCCR
jgi:hypothetical protein